MTMTLAAGLFRRLALSISVTASLVLVAQAQTTTSPAVQAKAKAKADKKLDLNTATADELGELPGVGPVTLKKILDGRPYKAVADLEKAGVPTKTIEGITPLVTVGAAPKAEVPKAKAKMDEPKAKAKAEPEKAVGLVDLNTAKAEELEALPGVGPAIAKDIIAARPFKSVNELENIKGLGEAKVAALKPKVKVVTAAAPVPKAKMDEPKAKTKAETPVVAGLIDLNTADAAALETLPGVGPAIAKDIIAARPFKSVDELEKIKGLGEAKITALKPKVKVTTATAAPKAESPKMTKAEAKKDAVASKTKPKEVIENEGELSGKAAALTGSGKKININTATPETLMELPGIGPVKSKAIVDARPFKTIEDIKEVNGIGDVTFGHLKSFITIK